MKKNICKIIRYKNKINKKIIENKIKIVINKTIKLNNKK